MRVEEKDITKYDMRIIVAGGRDFTDKNRVVRAVEQIILKNSHRNILFISGAAATGPDRMIIDYCKQWALDYIEVPADWNNIVGDVVRIKYQNGRPYNALAGFARNQKMADMATHLIAYWDRKSHGTADMIERAKEGSLNTAVLYY